MNKFIFLVVAVISFAFINNVAAQQDSKKKYKKTMKSFKTQFKNFEKELVRLQDERMLQLRKANKIQKAGTITPTFIKVIDRLNEKLTSHYVLYKETIQSMENYLDRQNSTQAILDLGLIDLEEKNLQEIKDLDRGKTMLVNFNDLKQMYTK